MISCLKNSFGQSIIDQKRIADLLNYGFSKLGEDLGLMEPYIAQSSDELSLNKKIVSLWPTSFSECRRFIKNLNINKLLGPSDIPAWALKHYEHHC